MAKNVLQRSLTVWGPCLRAGRCCTGLAPTPASWTQGCCGLADDFGFEAQPPVRAPWRTRRKAAVCKSQHYATARQCT
ncbi:hypothetical protein GCM10018962_42880 [Dactylosporangium matsuzakiense]|uniref:Uncharacterized protein n=1 Tax=Dactylosporangium matsuzakiense TaxID=53360 RepID=A0A9W6NKB3_9ACTN|nr:hypothetical protein GCM10017581_016330 [Dactylosporangium matsuzakiense]